jgi:hypothetical protein
MCVWGDLAYSDVELLLYTVESVTGGRWEVKGGTGEKGGRE